MFELRHYIEAFSHLHTAKVKGHKAPHKAVLLLAIIDLVEERGVASPRIELSDELVDKFNKVWYHYLGTSTIFTPDITKPYFHMQHESFWRLVEHEETEMLMVAEDCPWIEGKMDSTGLPTRKDLPQGSYSIKAMRNAFAYAEIDNFLYQLLLNADARAMLRVILINEYLTNQPTKTMPNLTQLMMALPLIALVA